jgi:hypothetical protein
MREDTVDTRDMTAVGAENALVPGRTSQPLIRLRNHPSLRMSLLEKLKIVKVKAKKQRSRSSRRSPILMRLNAKRFKKERACCKHGQLERIS